MPAEPMPLRGISASPHRGSIEATYDVSRTWVLGLNTAGVVLVATFAVLLAWPASCPIARRLLMDEQGPVELGTFLSFAAAAVLSGRLAGQIGRRDGRPGVARAYVLFAAFCAFAAMEEISWGESLFGYSAPRWWRLLNEQGEANLHDLPGIMELNSAFVFLFGVAGLVWARLGVRERFRAYAVPRALVPLFVLVTVMGAVETVNDFVFFGYVVTPLIGALSESVELVGAVACLACVWLNGRMLRREWTEPALAAADDGPARRAA